MFKKLASLIKKQTKPKIEDYERLREINETLKSGYPLTKSDKNYLEKKSSKSEDDFENTDKDLPSYSPRLGNVRQSTKSVKAELEKQIAEIEDQEKQENSDNADTKYVFDKWISKGPNPVIIPNAQSSSTTIEMLEPYVIEAKYKKSYLVNVWTPFGNAIGAGFYDENEVAEITLSSNEVVVQPNQVRKIFSGWDTHGARIMDFGEGSDELAESGGMGQNLIVFVDGPTEVTAEWKSQYFLDVQSTTKVKVKGSGWYDLGRMVPISVDNLSTPAGMWSAETFDRWTGDIDKETANARVMMNGPKSVVAEFKVDNTPGIVNSIILAAMAGVGALVFKKTRKNIKFSKTPKRPEDFEEYKQNPFEKYSEEQRFDDFEFHPRQQKKTTAIIDWLMGK